MNTVDKVKTTLITLSGSKKFKYFMLFLWAVVCAVLAFDVIHNGKYYYETGDDMFIEYINGGAYGECNPRNVYNHIFLGWLFSALYKIFPGANWNNAFYFSLIFVSFFVIGVCLILRAGYIKGFLMSVILVFSTTHSLLVKLNYSKTGILTVSVGLVFLISTLDTPDWKSKRCKFLRILSFLMILLGALVREKSFIALIPYFVIVGIYVITKDKENKKKLLPIAGIGLLITLLWVGNDISYNLNSDWKFYSKYNSVRTELLDYGFPSYDEYESQYHDIGISYNDYRMLYYWNHADMSVFGIDKLEQIKAIRDTDQANRFSIQKIGNTIKNAIGLSTGYAEIYILILLFLIFVAMDNGSNFSFQAATTLIGLGEYGYIIYNGRINDRAVIASIIPALFVLTLFCGNETRKDSLIKYIRGLVCLVGVMFYAFYGCRFCDMKYVKPNLASEHNQASALLSYTSSHKESLYLMGPNENAAWLSSGHCPVDSVTPGMLSNVVICGGWTVSSPIMTDIAEPYGDKYNPFGILASNSNAYWLAGDETETAVVLTYIREHYNKDAECTIVDTIDKYNVYSFAIKTSSVGRDS